MDDRPHALQVLDGGGPPPAGPGRASIEKIVLARMRRTIGNRASPDGAHLAALTIEIEDLSIDAVAFGEVAQVALQLLAVGFRLVVELEFDVAVVIRDQGCFREGEQVALALIEEFVEPGGRPLGQELRLLADGVHDLAARHVVLQPDDDAHPQDDEREDGREKLPRQTRRKSEFH